MFAAACNQAAAGPGFRGGSDRAVTVLLRNGLVVEAIVTVQATLYATFTVFYSVIRMFGEMAWQYREEW